MTNEELLEKAKKLYPVGTKFKCKHLSCLCEVTMDGTWDTFNIDNKPSVIFYPKEGFGKYAYLEWLSTEWAEIVELPKQEEKSLVGRYLKRLNYSIFSCKVSDYLQILNDYNTYLFLHKYGRLEKNDMNHWELMPEGWTPEQENTPQFEVGKWYKFIWKWDSNSWYYGKFKEFSSGCYSWDLWFRIDGSNLINKPSISKTELGEYKLLTDLSEIQPYLPDEHPDKIVKQEYNNSIPEYVEYIDTKYKGEIVKVEDWKCGSYCKVIFSNGQKEQLFKHLVKPSTKEAYEAQFSETPLTLKECISNSDNIEVGDEVEIIKNGSGNCSPNSIGYRFIVKEIYKGEDIYLREFKGKSTGVDISYCKLIKKASQTTTTYEKQVAEQPKNVPITTNIKIPKSVSVTLTNTEKEVKLTIKKPKTIKI